MKKWRVKLMCIDDEGEADMLMPFVPMAGLYVRVPFWEDEFHPISQVYWYEDEKRFDAFVELPDDR